MLKINRKVEYALMALKYIWERKDQNQIVSAREICDQFNTPFDTTAKVMQAMNNSGILHSSKGINGGYSLAKNLNQITYMELVNIVEKKDANCCCQSTKGNCELIENCNIKGPVEKLNLILNQFLNNLTILELFTMTFTQKAHELTTNLVEVTDEITMDKENSWKI